MENMYSCSVRLGTIHLSVTALILLVINSAASRWDQMNGIMGAVIVLLIFVLSFIIAAFINVVLIGDFIDHPLQKRTDATFFLKHLLSFPEIYYYREEIARQISAIYFKVFSHEKCTPRCFHNKIFGPTAIYSEAQEVQAIYRIVWMRRRGHLAFLISERIPTALWTC